jgi:hypothetical protein
MVALVTISMIVHFLMVVKYLIILKAKPPNYTAFFDDAKGDGRIE